MTDIDAKNLKEEIDINRNEKIEIAEMEKFLESEDNVRRLGEALDSDMDDGLLQEFKDAMKGVCETIPNAKIGANQYKILSFYLKISDDNEKTRILTHAGSLGTISLTLQYNNIDPYVFKGCEMLTLIRLRGHPFDHIDDQTYQEITREIGKLCEKMADGSCTIDQYKMLFLYLAISDKKDNFCEKVSEKLEKDMNGYDIKKCTLDQFKAILFYYIITDEKDGLHKKLKGKLNKAANDYWKKGKHEGPILAYMTEKKLAEISKNVASQMFFEKIEMAQENMEKMKERETKNKMRKEAKDEWEKDKTKVKQILAKEGALDKQDKDELIAFRDKYYITYAANYENPEYEITDDAERVEARMGEFDLGDQTLPLSPDPWGLKVDGFVGQYNDPEREYDRIVYQIEEKLSPDTFKIMREVTKEGGKLPTKIEGLSKLREWVNKNKLNFPAEYNKLKDKISKEVENITNKNLKKESLDLNNINKYQTGIFQLRANVEYGENLKINGAKSNLSNKQEISEGEITSLYVYRQWISVRESKEYPNIEKIPNINELLSSIEDNTQMNKIFRNFMVEIFLPIKNDKYGQTIENMIEGAYNDAGQGGPFSRLLINLINKYICDTTGYSSFKVEGEKKGKEVTMGDYLDKMIKGSKKELKDMQKKADKAEQERIKAEQERIKLEKQMEILNGAEKTMKDIEKDVNTIIEYAEDPGKNADKAKSAFHGILNKIFTIPSKNKQLEAKQRKELETYKTELLIQVIGLMHIFFTYGTIQSEFGETISSVAVGLDVHNKKKYEANNRQIDLLKQIEAIQRSRWYFNYKRPSNRELDSWYGIGSPDRNRKVSAIRLGITFPGGFVDKSANNRFKPEDTHYIYYEDDANAKTVGPNMFLYDNHNGHFGYDNLNTLHKGNPYIEPSPFDYQYLWFKFSDCDKIKDLINRANKGEILLCFDIKNCGTVNNPISLKNFAIAEQSKDGYNLTWQGGILYSFKENLNKTELYRIENNFKTTVFADKEVRTGIEKVQQLGEILEGIQDIVDRGMKNHEVSEDVYNNILYCSELLLNHKNTLKKNNYCKRIIVELQYLKKQSQVNKFINDTDKSFNDIIAAIQQLDDFINGSAIDDFYRFLHNQSNFHENDTFWKRAWQRIKENGLAIICGIATAVAAVLMIPTGGLSGGVLLLVNSAIMSIGGMIGAAAGTYLNNRLKRTTGDRKIELPDGSFTIVQGAEKRTTNLGQLYRAIQNGDGKKIGENIVNVIGERGMGTVTTAFFMGAGKLAGGRFSKLARSYPNSPAVKFLQNIPWNKLKTPDPATNALNGVGNSVKNVASRKLRQFRGEFVEETREETTETLAENSNIPALAFTVQLWHSLTPKGHPKVYVDNKVTFGNIDIQGNNITIDLVYDNASIDGLRQHFEDIGYTFNEETKTFSKQNDEKKNYTNVIKLVETKQPFEKRNCVSELAQYGIKMNYETGEVYYTDQLSLSALQETRAKSGKGVVTIDENNLSAKLRTGDMVLDVYFEGKNHKYEGITQGAAESNSKFMDYILNEKEGGGGGGGGGGNEGKEHQMIVKIRDKIEVYYYRITGEKLTLTDDQIKSVIEAHKQKGILGEIRPVELMRKNKILAETIEDPEIRRFLFESGFCGSLSTDIDSQDIIITDEMIEEDEDFVTEEELDEALDAGEVLEELTEDQQQTLEYLKNKIGVEVIKGNDIYKLLQLRPDQIKKLEFLKNNIGKSFKYSNEVLEYAETGIEENVIEKIEELKKIGVDFNQMMICDKDSLSNLLSDYAGVNIETLKKLKQEGIEISFIYKLGDLCYGEVELKRSDIKNIKILDKLGEVYSSENLEKIEKMKEKVGIGLNDIVNNLNEIRDIFGIQVNLSNLVKIVELRDKGIYIEDIFSGNNIGSIKEKIRLLKESGMNMDVDLLNIIETAEIDIENIFTFEAGDIYKEYRYHQEEIEAHKKIRRGRIVENIQTLIQKKISSNEEADCFEIINEIRADLMYLPKTERLEIIKQINEGVRKFNTVRKYLDFKNGPYKSPKELLCAMRGITDPNILSQITDDITVRQHGVGLTFFVWDVTSYNWIYNIDSSKDTGTAGFNTSGSSISDLKGTLSVVNGEDPGGDTDNFNPDDIFGNWARLDYETIRHEGQHNRNTIFMPDKNYAPITRAKDEITAYLRDGRNISEIEEKLTRPASEGGVYQYGLDGDAREAHKDQVRELLGYAESILSYSENGLVEREKIISMLADTPVDGWKDVCYTINKAVEIGENNKQEAEKIKGQFVNLIKKRAYNNKLVRKMVNVWNSIFPNNRIDLYSREFWWTGIITEPARVILNIDKCISLKEIKYILNDPQFSHIGRGENNKCGMEISMIIDEVVEGRLPITQIPKEIRPYIEKFIDSGNISSSDVAKNQAYLDDENYAENFEIKNNISNNTNKTESLGDELQNFVKFDPQKEYNQVEDFGEIENLISIKLGENPDNVYLQRRRNEIELAILYCKALDIGGIGKLSCIDMNRGIYKLSTKKGDLFGSIYSIIDTDSSLLEYKPIADAVAFNENNLMGIKPNEGIKISSIMVNSGSFAQANIHKYPADIDLAEHMKITIEGDGNPQQALSKLLVTHVQNHIRTMMSQGRSDLFFLEAMIGYSKTKKRPDGQPRALRRSAEEILNGVHKGEGVTLEEACENPGFFKFNYTLIDSNGVPKECTKVTSITIEQNGKIVRSNTKKGVGFQEVYFSSPEGYNIIDDIYKTESVDYYYNDFLKKDICHYWEGGNALKVCKRLYNYVKTEGGWTDKGKSCIEKLSSLFENPVLSGVSLVDGLKIGIKEKHNIGNVINLLREYGNKCLDSEEKPIFDNYLKQIENGESIKNSVKKIDAIITKKVEFTVLSYINNTENNVINEYLNPILGDIEYNSKNNR